MDAHSKASFQRCCGPKKKIDPKERRKQSVPGSQLRKPHETVPEHKSLKVSSAKISQMPS
jgi:hypothetical protein